MADIAPGLYAKIKESFDQKYAQAQLFGGPLSETLAKINSGTATFRDADLYAVEVGSMMADAMKEHLILEDLPEKTLYRNIAQRTIGEGLKDTYGIVSNVARTIQEEINAENKIGLKVVQPKLETDRVDKIVNRAVNAKSQKTLDNNLTDTVPTFARQVVDDTQKANAKLHHKAGLNVKVEREYDDVGLHNGTDVCDWCMAREGKFDYEKAMDVGAFERHEGCGCIITYTSAKGEVTRSTSKYGGWEKPEEREARKKAEKIILDAQDAVVTPSQREALALLKQDGGDATIPGSLIGDYSDFSPLEITSEERQILVELHEMSMKDDVEHGIIIVPGGDNIKCPESDHNGVKMPISNVDATGLKMYHSHTNDTPLSTVDLSKLLYEKVDEVAVATRNGDAFIVSIGDGWRPTEEEYGAFVVSLEKEVNLFVATATEYSDLSPAEKNYVAIREQAYRICREFEWKMSGGQLYE